MCISWILIKEFYWWI